MNNYNLPPQWQTFEKVTIGDRDYVRDLTTEISVPFDISNPSHAALLAPAAEPESGTWQDVHSSKGNKRSYTLGSRVAMGSFAIGMLLTPFAYKAAGKSAYDVMNAINPLEDKVLEQTTVWEDVMSTFNGSEEKK
ncbi:MAG: hypothetical protein JWO55_791 [Candidatus Saccharibacteria bacterium]|jgi:hypothetical protein|nr:hypothetical protein [Candidatus Saccharibacteria bacterium]